jgi:hypothetical protein
MLPSYMKTAPLIHNSFTELNWTEMNWTADSKLWTEFL